MNFTQRTRHPLFDPEHVVNLDAADSRHGRAVAAIQAHKAATEELHAAAGQVCEDLRWAFGVSDGATRDEIVERYSLGSALIKRATTPNTVPTVLTTQEADAVYAFVSDLAEEAAEAAR